MDIGQYSCGLPLAVIDELWLQPCDGSSSTVVVNAKTASLRGSIPNTGGAAMATAAGSVWVSSYAETDVRRIDPRTLKVLATIHVPSGVVISGAGAIWSFGLDSDGNGDKQLVKIDPRSNRVLARYSVPVWDGPFATFAFGSIWVKGNDDPALTRIDPATGRSSTVRLPGWAQLEQYYDQPIAVGDNALWIRVNGKTVARIDPRTGRVGARYPADPNGGGGYPMVAFGSLWIANFGADTVWRDRLGPG